MCLLKLPDESEHTYVSLFVSLIVFFSADLTIIIILPGPKLTWIKVRLLRAVVEGLIFLLDYISGMAHSPPG